MVLGKDVEEMICLVMLRGVLKGVFKGVLKGVLKGVSKPYPRNC